MKLQEVLRSLEVGDRIYYPGEKRGYEVKARDDRYIICTKPHFKTCMYTIIDVEEMVNGANNLVFNMYDYLNQEDIEECLKDLSFGKIEISYRNRIKCKFDRFKKKSCKKIINII